MPLQSRASTARVQRTAPEQKPADVANDVQPRTKGGVTAANEAGKPAPADAPSKDTANDDGAQNASQSDSGTQQQQAPAPQRTRKARETKPASGTKVDANGAGTTDKKALQARLREIEKEFKLLIPEEQKSMRDVAAKFKEKRLALESEHRLITGQLSAAIFHG